MKVTRRLAILITVMIVIGVILGAVLIQMSSNNVLKKGQATNAPKQGQATVVHSDFSFNNQKALNFFQNLSTPTGLLMEYPNSHTIYLSDDQQLDYAALTTLNDSSLAIEISSALQVSLGGLYGSFNPSNCYYGNWNGVDVVLGMYMQIPCSGEWNLYSGFDEPVSPNTNVPNSSGYKVDETVWGGQMGNDYTQYVDLELYYAINQLHYGNCLDAVYAFEHANSFWNGQGFADQAYQSSPNGYTSYKLALDVMAFRLLMNNSNTEGSVASYTSTINQVQTVMSALQGKDGGVPTNYLSVVNGNATISAGTYENGESTSLFVLAE
jgi:hypothetical protein